MEVSWNGGTPQSSIEIGCSMIFQYKPTILGEFPIYGKPFHIFHHDDIRTVDSDTVADAVHEALCTPVWTQVVQVAVSNLEKKGDHRPTVPISYAATWTHTHVIMSWISSI